MPSATIDISVVVATYQRRDVLRVTLNRLAQQTFDKDRFEIIVSDDGSTDGTGAMVSEFAAHAPCRVRYLYHANRGPGYSQNRGIRESVGQCVLLIADDIHPLPEMLAAHVQAHEQFPDDHIAIAGKVVQSPDLPMTTFQRLWDPFRYSALESLAELPFINFWACNVSFKREFMLRFGMFIERTGAAHEDTEVGWRLHKHGGMRLLYRPDALAHHYHVETVDAACRRAYERGLNFDMLLDAADEPCLLLWFQIVPRDRRRLQEAFLHPAARTLALGRSPGWCVLRDQLRRIVFNRAVTDHFFVPLIRSAESNRWSAAMLAIPGLGRRLVQWTVAHHFHRGLEALRRRRCLDCSGLGRLTI